MRRHVERFDAHGDAIELIDGRENELQACALRLGYQAAETEDYAAFPFLDDVDAVPEPDQEDADDYRNTYQWDFHFVLLKVARREISPR